MSISPPPNSPQSKICISVSHRSHRYILHAVNAGCTYSPPLPVIFIIHFNLSFSYFSFVFVFWSLACTLISFCPKKSPLCCTLIHILRLFKNCPIQIIALSLLFIVVNKAISSTTQDENINLQKQRRLQQSVSRKCIILLFINSKFMEQQITFTHTIIVHIYLANRQHNKIAKNHSMYPHFRTT